MEPAIAVEIVTNHPQLDEANVVLGTLIGDDDASVIQNVRRNSTVPVEKWSDLNHTEKSFNTDFYNLKIKDDKVHSYLKTCFCCAIARNKGNPPQLKKDIMNIVNHAYGDHRECGEWCRYQADPSKYKHEGLPGGKDLSDPLLKAALIPILSKYANKANRIAPCGSTQANENLNQMVAIKHPKNRHYGGSESLAVRVASAVVDKNDGRFYVVDVNKELGVSPGAETEKFRRKQDERRQHRGKKQGEVNTKRRRLFVKKNRARKGAAQERREGDSYHSNCGLLDGIDELVDDPSEPTRVATDDSTAIVFYDLETSGLSKLSCEILQVAAKTGEAEFSAYILPEKTIAASASSVTGLTVSDGVLYKNEEPVLTTPPRIVLLQLLEFCQKAGESVVLVAHNGNKFDAPIILRDYKRFGLLELFKSRVSGFVDSLEVFTEKLPDRKDSFRQTALAELYKVDTINAHDALGDVKMLASIVDAAVVTKSQILHKAKTVTCLIRKELELANAKVARVELQVLKPGVSDNMLKKIADAGITLGKLQAAYTNGGEKGLPYLLGENVGNNVRVTKNRKSVGQIIDSVKRSLSAQQPSGEVGTGI